MQISDLDQFFMSKEINRHRGALVVIDTQTKVHEETFEGIE